MGSENMSNIGPTKHVVGIEDNLESFYSGTDEKKILTQPLPGWDFSLFATITNCEAFE